MSQVLTENDFVARVTAGEWPSYVAHGIVNRFYDYDTVVVRWADDQIVTYKMGDGRTGYGDNSAFARANLILSIHARKANVASVELDRAANPAQT